MPVIKIHPIDIRTKNGTEGFITGVDLGSPDAIVGHVPLPNGKSYDAKWDLLGRARDNDGSMDFKIEELDEDEWSDLKEYIKTNWLASIKAIMLPPEG
ncbi:hypothetical protein [Pseudomonas syringae]|uniref:hypothetical protein n=1 Tax=Pseudomonas syringae TaxID=317 RepID=UPI000466C618|nr:hypothetical protein [Pseudomonas syringae]QGG76411.1 hypothetical protein N028_13955 [Pseudomonas syringae USA011]